MSTEVKAYSPVPMCWYLAVGDFLVNWVIPGKTIIIKKNTKHIAKAT